MSLSMSPILPIKITGIGKTIQKVDVKNETTYGMTQTITLTYNRDVAYQLHHILTGYDGFRLEYNMSPMDYKVVYMIDENFIYTISSSKLNSTTTAIHRIEYDKNTLLEVKRFSTNHTLHQDIFFFWRKTNDQEYPYELVSRDGFIINPSDTTDGRWHYRMHKDKVKYMCMGLGHLGSWASSPGVVTGNIHYVQGLINSELHNTNAPSIDPSISTKAITQFIDGQEHRFLTEDMVVDPSKVDVSKAITLHPSAPKILTEECLNVATTLEERPILECVNPIIGIDTTCEGCDKLG
ncbi:hypothetical protein [Romboutsia sp.]|uniref:hypothetical protein n=1 Tax=Romboutsia sp. TaxID=1965302 RepID=UPI003F3C3334